MNDLPCLYFIKTFLHLKFFSIGNILDSNLNDYPETERENEGKIVNYKNKNCLEADVPDFLFIGQILKQKS
jgi:hypothetical protein